MRLLCLFILLLVYCATISAQENNDYTEIYNNAESIVFTEPQEAAKITDLLIEGSEDKEQLVNAYLLNASAQ